MKNFLLLLFLFFSSSINSQTLLQYDNMETSSQLWGSAGWYYYQNNSLWATNYSVSPNTSAVIYGIGTGSSPVEQNWYVMPNVTGLNSNNPHQLKFRLASYKVTAPTAATAGVDVDDIVDIQLSYNGGTTYVSELRITGYNSGLWPYSNNGSITHTANGSFASNDIYQTNQGGYSYITLNLPVGITQVAVDVLCRINSAGEEWWIDNIELWQIATPPANPTSISATQNTICNGSSTTLTANGAVGVVYWYIGGCASTFVSTGNSISVSPASTTTYYARNLNGGLFSSGCASTTITVNPNPTVTINAVTNTICSGSNTQLISNVNGSSPTYLWSPSTGLSNASAPSPFASPTTTQTYQLTVTANGCSTSTSTTINVNPSVGFVSTISGNNTIIAGTQESYSITPIANVTYQWAYTESVTAPLWINVPNSNSPSITFTWPQTTTNGSARVIISNAYGCGTQTRFFNIITNGALPVELLSFVGVCDNNLISLTWKTASEHNSDYFEVFKSRDGINWSILTTLNSAGNSTQELTYTTKDENAIDGNNYYKLLQYDIDGQSKEYGPINVMCSENTKGYFSIFPNPSSGSFQVVLNNKNMVGDGKLIIKDTKGSEILNKEINIVSGINLYNIGGLNMVDGIYYIQVSNGNFLTQIIKQIIK